jgi:hypothetical protein
VSTIDGVELLAVDYWSSTLGDAQVEAQQPALAAAQRKAKVLLGVFADPPQPINVHENTRIVCPQQLYQAVPATEDNAATWYARNDLPRVPASRPLRIFYRRLFTDLDVTSPVMPGKREIEVVSTVRLYFESPSRLPAPR